MRDYPTVGPYLDLLEKCLTGTLRPEKYMPLQPGKGGVSQTAKRIAARAIEDMLKPARLELVRRVRLDPEGEELDWPARAETMIGRKSLGHLRSCIDEVLRRDVPGDFIECGVWRGGATIFMRAMLMAYGDAQRRVWVADSFRGLPPPDAANYPADRDFELDVEPRLAISLEEVKANFKRYGLFDERVRFLPGWFKDSLPDASIERLAILRADGDMYESTIQIMNNLYPKLSVGGFCVIDDYGTLDPCRQAIEDYRRDHAIDEPIEWIDSTGVFWRRKT
ncbi:MAG: TylF/MycF/NovP-related O-methyltransferase [Burkholderiales bacterium]